MSRRAKVSPEQAGLPRGGGLRRVEGLRREEVAILAGVSTEYYAQIERGDIGRASDEILHAIANALQLDDVERQHLLDLSRAAQPPVRKPVTPARVHPNVLRMLDAMTALPTTIQNGRLDLLAANPLGQAVYTDVYARHQGAGVPNLARYLFLDAHSRETFPDWHRVADDAVATLQTESARSPHTKALVSLIGQLSTVSVEFRAKWATHNVSAHRRGKKRMYHPEVGELEFEYEAMELPGAPGLQMITFLAEPASATDDALRLLASWNAPATLNEPEPVSTQDEAGGSVRP